jgi:hypothetical protein
MYTNFNHKLSPKNNVLKSDISKKYQTLTSVYSFYRLFAIANTKIALVSDSVAKWGIILNIVQSI